MINIIDSAKFITEKSQGAFYKLNDLAAGHILRIEDFIRCTYSNNLVTSLNIDYSKKHYIFFAICDPNLLINFDIDYLSTYVKDNKNLCICISYPLESHISNDIVEFVNRLLETYQQATIWFSHANAIATSISDLHYSENYGWDRVKYIPYPLFEIHYLDYTKNRKITPVPQQPLEKTFVLLLRLAKPWRILFYLWCKDNGILKNSYYSWRGEGYEMYRDRMYELWTTPTNVNQNVSKYLDSHLHFSPEHNTLLSTVVEVDPETNKNIKDKQWELPEKIYATSFMQIVCETAFANDINVLTTTVTDLANADKNIFITEKTYKAIFYKQPFILLGLPHSLAYLKSLGYKTFSSIFNEAYDNVEDPNHRFAAICKEIKRINNLDPIAINLMRIHITEIVEHNYNLLMSTPTKQIIKHTLETKLLNE